MRVPVMSTRFIRSSLLGCALCVACSGKLADETLREPSSSAFTNAYAHAVCDSLAPCCGANRLAYDYTWCLKRAAADATWFTPESTDRCLRAASDAYSNCGVAKRLDVMWRECRSGSKATGEVCHSATDCAPVADRVTCEPDQKRVPTSLWKCRAYRWGQVGDRCSGPGADGVSTLCGPVREGLDGRWWTESHCDYQLGVCVALPTVKLGETCEGDNCELTARCDVRTWRCAPKLKLGEPCMPSGDDCESGYCDQTAARCLANPWATQSLCGPNAP